MIGNTIIVWNVNKLLDAEINKLPKDVMYMAKLTQLSQPLEMC